MYFTIFFQQISSPRCLKEIFTQQISSLRKASYIILNKLSPHRELKEKNVMYYMRTTYAFLRYFWYLKKKIKYNVL